ncbi:MAG: hypothetical protein JKX67_11670 [Colwellia sp.]|nr:hypothetical protein [Colwellia sp.]
MMFKKSSKQLVVEANQKIITLAIIDAVNNINRSDVQFIDIREKAEIDERGTIPGSIHVPRGVLEFVVDPDSPYFNSVFEEPKQFILFCQSAWRSALATLTLQEMGLQNVSHIEGGYAAWLAANAPIEINKDSHN